MWLLYSCPDIRFVSFRFFLLFSSPLPRCFLSAILVPQAERNAIKITATKQIWLVVLGPCVPFVFPALSQHLPTPVSASDCRHAMSTSPFCTCNTRRQQKFFAQFCETHSTVLFCLNFVSLPLRSPLLQLVCHLLVVLCT